MPRGNSSDPFNARGINWEGQTNNPWGLKSSKSGGSPGDSWGPDDFAVTDHLDRKGNRQDKNSKMSFTNEKTGIDTPLGASVQRVKKNSSSPYKPEDWYGAGNDRKG